MTQTQDEQNVQTSGAQAQDPTSTTQATRVTADNTSTPDLSAVDLSTESTTPTEAQTNDTTQTDNNSQNLLEE
jgi:hypothetical protein